MNCETLRERWAAEPSAEDEAFERHAEGCPACQAFRSRLLRAEALIHDAVRFDVDAIGKPARTEEARSSRLRSLMLPAGIAAGFAIALTFWALQGGDVVWTPEALAAEVSNHWYNEPDSWVETDNAVSSAALTSVLDGSAELDFAELETVSYAQLCLVAGQWIPHLVVQGEQSPYMVLLMPDRVLASPVPLQLPSEGLSGHILPVGTGSIAVLGGGLTPELEQIEASVVSAVNWTI